MSADLQDKYKKIYRYCYLRVKNRETAEDITQETFLRFIEHPDIRDLTRNFSFYIPLPEIFVLTISEVSLRMNCRKIFRTEMQTVISLSMIFPFTTH